MVEAGIKSDCKTNSEKHNCKNDKKNKILELLPITDWNSYHCGRLQCSLVMIILGTFIQESALLF